MDVIQFLKNKALIYDKKALIESIVKHFIFRSLRAPEFNKLVVRACLS